MPSLLKPLFRPDVLAPRIRAFTLPAQVQGNREVLGKWAELFSTGRALDFKERELLPDFISDIFYGILGYKSPIEGKDVYTLNREKVVEVDGKFADAVLGRFTKVGNDFLAAVEGKGPKDPLDRPHGGRRLSAVEQGYQYATNLPCPWVIVSSMKETRLYHKGSDQYTCERFEIERLATDEIHLKKFVFLLGAERMVPPAGESHLHSLLAESDSADRQLTRDYYKQYADLRHQAFLQLCEANPEVDKKKILSCTQRILDRILFCAFCEDRGLLPKDTIRQAFAHKDVYNPRPVWENFKALFRFIDIGNQSLKIPRYNGGLFAHDPEIENLRVPDEACEFIKILGEYDYRPISDEIPLFEEDGNHRAVDVDVLGHIFEQSITDLERLRADIDSSEGVFDFKKHQSRRKKEGAFYTPNFITRYIVEQTLRPVLQDRFNELKTVHLTKAKGTAKKSLEDPETYDLGRLKAPQRQALYDFWFNWSKELGRIRVLDPACGSGAFLIQAFDEFIVAYGRAVQHIEELLDKPMVIDLDKQILEKNLYGVDLNEEAIEICKLSLWIKTAQRGKILTSLDHTIREGNSVIDDPEVHPRAFNWHESFPEVFADGGFDVVVGNPPYIRQELLAPYKPFWGTRFKSYHGVADIFGYFIELGYELLRGGGRLGFITSGSWVRGNFGSPLRKFLAENVQLESMVDFGEYQPFEGAEMIRPSITVFRKGPRGGEMRLFKWLTKGKPPTNLSDVISVAKTMKTKRLDEKTWNLEPDAVLSLLNKMLKAGPSLKSVMDGKVFRGVTTGLNEAFVIDASTKERLIKTDPKSGEIIKPFRQGTHLRPWYMEESNDYLIFTRRGIDIKKYPAVLEHLTEYRDRLEPKPPDWDEKKQGKWPGRKPGVYQWFEIQDSVDYWEGFQETKIVWPDISKLPRFSMDPYQTYLGNTGYIVPGGDDFLLGILSSWATWFCISKTAQPLRLRGDRWQYRLIAQFMEKIPVPRAEPSEKNQIGDLARDISSKARSRYIIQERFRKRVRSTFGGDSQNGEGPTLNKKASSWWRAEFIELGEAIKSSLNMKAHPFRNPRTADEWEPYFAEKKAEVLDLAREIVDLESELNDRVYRLYGLTGSEISLLKEEVAH